MASPKVICKSGYTRKAKHFANSLNYAGNKIEGQLLVYKDGSMRSVLSDKAITLTDAEANDLLYIEMAYKDGGSDRLDYETYKRTFVQSVTVNELAVVLDEPGELGKSYHDLQDLDFIKYTQYVAERPGVEKSAEGHGLFGLNGDVDINEALTEADEYIESTKWMHILSLPEGEDIRTGFNKREMWQALVAAKAPRIAKLYNISLENLVIYGGFHSNTDNAHCHLMFYSKDKTEGFIPGGTHKLEQASRKLSSIFLNEIYKDDIAVLNREKNHVRDQFTHQLNQQLTTLKHKHTVAPQLIEKLQTLSKHLKSTPGKHEYGYLPPPLKSMVNDLLREFISTDQDLQEIYESFLKVQKSYIKNYVASPQKIARDMQEFERNFFAPPKNSLRIFHNAIIRYADLLADAANPTPTTSPKQRTTEGKIADYIPDDSYLSSLVDSTAQPDQTEQRTTEGKITNYIPDDSNLSSVVDSTAQPDQAEQRTTEGKTADYIPNDDDLSSSMCKSPSPDLVNQRIAVNLLHHIGRLLCMQAVTTHQHNTQTQKADERSRESKQLFKTQKFKQQSFERPRQSISY